MQDAMAGGFISLCTDQTNSCLMNFIKKLSNKNQINFFADTAPYLFSDTK